jgi:hypothetical protein
MWRRRRPTSSTSPDSSLHDRDPREIRWGRAEALADEMGHPLLDAGSGTQTL